MATVTPAECAICLEDEFRLPVKLSCGHVFDYHCLRKLLFSPGSEFLCPIDRKAIHEHEFTYRPDLLKDDCITVVAIFAGTPVRFKISPRTTFRQIKPIVCSMWHVSDLRKRASMTVLFEQAFYVDSLFKGGLREYSFDAMQFSVKVGSASFKEVDLDASFESIGCGVDSFSFGPGEKIAAVMMGNMRFK
ncbi:MAG: RING finger protein [Simkaniaceae bacterium]|nr:RING finger protein [Simkaniaceae bacterium]